MQFSAGNFARLLLATNPSSAGLVTNSKPAKYMYALYGH